MRFGNSTINVTRARSGLFSVAVHDGNRPREYFGFLTSSDAYRLGEMVAAATSGAAHDRRASKVDKRARRWVRSAKSAWLDSGFSGAAL